MACRACRAAVCSACCRSGPTSCFTTWYSPPSCAVPFHPARGALAIRQVLKAIRDNEPRAISLGYDINDTDCWPSCSRHARRIRRVAETIVLSFATLSDVQQATSGEVILMTLLGGTGTFFGPVAGAAVVVTLQEYLSEIVGGWVTVIIGAVFVACVLTFRRGIVGTIAALRRGGH